MSASATPQQPVPVSVDQALAEAIDHHRAGRLQDAERLYRIILQQQPAQPDANHNLGLLAVQVGQPAAGLPHLKAALEANSGTEQYWLSYIDALIQAGQPDIARQVLALARHNGLQGNALEALGARLAAGDLDPNAGPAMPATDRNASRTGEPSRQQIETLVGLFNQGRYSEGEVLATELTANFPHHGFGWKVLGVLLMSQGRVADALAPLRRAAEQLPSDAQVQSNLGVLLGELNQAEEAEACHRRALAITPDFVEAHFNLGNSLHKQGRLDEAEASYRRTLALQSDFARAHYNLANVLGQQRRLPEAEQSYRRILEIEPDFADAHINLGSVLEDMNRVAEAETSYRRALELKPDFAEAHHNLGNIFKSRGELGEAEGSYLQALAFKPDFSEACNDLGNVLASQGRIEEAEASYRRALQIEPDYALAHYNIGIVLAKKNMLPEAEASYRRALAVKPDYVDALYSLGHNLLLQQRFSEAEKNLRRVLELQPDFDAALNNLGNALAAQDQFIEAEAYFKRALELNPGFADAHYSFGNLLMKQQRFADAETRYLQALAIKPDYVQALCNLGNSLQLQERLTEAEKYYLRTLALVPDHADAHYNLGNNFSRQEHYVAAEASFRQALRSKPDFSEALNNLGNMLDAQGRRAEAAMIYRQALEKNKSDYAHQSLSVISAFLSDFSGVVAGSDAALDLNPDSARFWEQRLYTFSYHPDLTAEQIFAEFSRWGDRFPDPVIDFSLHDRTPGRRLKVGYVSPDFRNHTSRFYFRPLFANHDPAQFELYAYSNVEHDDEFTAEFKELFPHWRDIRGLNTQQAADLVRADGIDILVDCCNHMRDDRLDVFTQKPAPIQVTWLGAAWTTGLKMVDYVLFDPYMAPEGTLAREKIVRLPHFFVAYQPREQTADIAPPPCLKNGYVTFGYSGRTERLNHRTFTVWGELLRQIPTARLILDFAPFADPATQEYYREFIARYGVDVERVVMRRSSNIFEGLNDFDILLDCFPHSGGTMLFDALWMGVPAITLASRPPVGRIGASLMMNLGLPEWVAKDQEEYVRKACAFAAQPKLLAELRAGMRERIQRSPVMDAPGFTRGVEAAYRTMYDEWIRQ